MYDGNGTQNNDLAPTRRDGGPLRASKNLKITSRRHAVARCRAAARSTSYSCIAIRCTTKSCCSIVAFVLILMLNVDTLANTKISINIILNINCDTHII